MKRKKRNDKEIEKKRNNKEKKREYCGGDGGLGKAGMTGYMVVNKRAMLQSFDDWFPAMLQQPPTRNYG